jgi:hypothetical protein
MLTVLVNETKILFLRACNLLQLAFLQLILLVASEFTQGSKTISFLKSKINAYYADYYSRLNTEVRMYSENYIHNHK